MSSTANSLQRAWWLKTLHQWHWISASVALIGLLLFSITGFTLNHASRIEAKPQVQTLEAQMPAGLAEALATMAEADAGQHPALPDTAVRWLAQQFGVDVREREIEWAPDEIYIGLPRPGGDAWLRITLPDGEVMQETTTRGWVSYLNDLHKGRNAGMAWSLFIDVFAGACLLFALTGLLILKLHAVNRPATWPLVAAGIVVPLLLALLTIH